MVSFSIFKLVTAFVSSKSAVTSDSLTVPLAVVFKTRLLAEPF